MWRAILQTSARIASSMSSHVIRQINTYFFVPSLSLIIEKSNRVIRVNTLIKLDDHTRVVLDAKANSNSSDYINASLIVCYRFIVLLIMFIETNYNYLKIMREPITVKYTVQVLLRACKLIMMLAARS